MKTTIAFQQQHRIAVSNIEMGIADEETLKKHVNLNT
jgi:hypothetical protein